MPVLIEDFESLEPTTVAEIESFLVDFIKAVEPNLDLSPSSVLFQFVVRLAAQYHGLNQQNINRVLSATSLKTVTENPTLADETALNNLASNYLVERKQGTNAGGQVRIILSANRFTPIADSLRFSSNGVVFAPTGSFSGVRTEAEVRGPTQRLITPFGVNQFSFIIDVVAVEPGTNGNVSANTVFTLSGNVPGVVSAVAVSDFDGGSDTESNEQLMERLVGGISTKNLGSRVAAKAMILSQFPAVDDVSIIGAGDSEMVRSRANALGIDSAGCGDIYVRTRKAPVTTQLTKLATYDSNTGQWTMTFQRDGDDPSGIYHILSIKPESRPDLTSTILSVHRSEDVSSIPGVDITPRFIVDGNYGGGLVFTRYQTMTVYFTETNADDMVDNQKRFIVEVLHMPQIAEVNDYVLARGNRHVGGDYVVRAPIPCMVGVELSIVRGPGDPDVDVDAVKQAVIDAVHAVDFQSGVLSADAILSSVRKLLPTRTRIQTPIGMRGRVFLPWRVCTAQETWFDSDGWIFNNYELKLSGSAYTKELSPRTSFFFTDSSLITVNVQASDHVSV